MWVLLIKEILEYPLASDKLLQYSRSPTHLGVGENTDRYYNEYSITNLLSINIKVHIPWANSK